jgi:hypothetical protein
MPVHLQARFMIEKCQFKTEKCQSKTEKCQGNLGQLRSLVLEMLFPGCGVSQIDPVDPLCSMHVHWQRAQQPAHIRAVRLSLPVRYAVYSIRSVCLKCSTVRIRSGCWGGPSLTSCTRFW